MTDTLLIDRQSDGVVVITFNRPQVMNALSLDTMRHFADTVARLTDDDDLRALILTGAGKRAFCSGADLIEFSHYPAASDGLNMITLMGDALLVLESLPVPVIAAINGYALGGGSEIALACDMRIVDEETRAGFVQIRNGLTPGWGAGQRLLRLVGYPRALELLVSGRIMPAPELEALGLANRVVPTGTALNHALDFAHQIAQSPPAVVRAIKSLLQAGINQSYEAALKTERTLFPPLWAAEPHLKAVENFVNRQKDKPW